jgi:hypothetical protein
VELIVERKQLSPSAKKKTDETLVPVQIAYGATKLGKMARSAGGEWDPDVKLWYIQYDKIKGTELEQHIILDAGKKKTTK